MQIVDGASEVGGTTGGHWWDAEFHRVRGNILLLSDAANLGAAEASFSNALKAAKDRQALFFEMRAATDLARLRLEQGEAQAARELLVPVLSSLSEGRALPNFLNASKLLDRYLSG